ncbi:Oleosin [Thalictrum thalictroides]|uniref:Oleosin n=1 Tax=Thalictrum thalictroides TaxID=46969 RepID=A0A7J6VDI6_THATH|nr:Oleosin [Thalictrum thalictroides]
MADRQTQSVTQRPTRATNTTTSSTNTFLKKLHEHVPNSTQLIGLLTLVVSGGILLIFTGLTITTSILALIFFTPLIIISSPLWLPIGTVIFIATAGFLSMCGFGVGTLATVTWLYKYVRGTHPIGSDRVDYARSRIANTATHVKDYAKEYGGYLQSKVKDAAPSA